MNQKGFTIVELMAATTVFAVLLMIVTFAVLRIGQVYYRGINSARTQDVTRSIIDEVSRAIQLSDGEVEHAPGVTQAYCVGSNRFVFREEVRQEEGATPVLRSYNGTSSCDVTDIVTNLDNPRTLLGENMQILEFTINNIGDNLHRVTLSIAYGTDDDIDFATRSCLPGFGSQFCAVSELSTVVASRF